MMLRNNVPSVTWAQFELCNSDPQTAFENMCRILFNNFFFGGKAILHSDHNNPGKSINAGRSPKNFHSFGLTK